MTDQQLRATEREHAAGVASEDAVLTARLRAGTLTSCRVELAAYCGHAPSRRVTTPPMRKVVNGLTCCCGSDERDSEHNSIENYTHGFVHACEYYGTECTCDVTEHWAPGYREPVPNSFAKWLKGLHGRFETENENDVAMTLARVAAARLAREAFVASHPDRLRSGTIVEAAALSRKIETPLTRGPHVRAIGMRKHGGRQTDGACSWPSRGCRRPLRRHASARWTTRRGTTASPSPPSAASSALGHRRTCRASTSTAASCARPWSGR